MRARFFRFIAHIAARHARKIIAVAVALTIAAGAYAAATLRLNANLDDLVSEELEYHRRYIEFLEEFGDEEYLYVVVDSKGDMPQAKRFVEALAGRVEKIPDLKEIIFRIDNPALERNFLLYMTPDQLSALRAMVTDGPFSVRRIAGWKDISELFAALADRIGGPVSTADEAELAQGFTFIDGLIDDIARAIEREAPYSSRLQELFFGDGETFDTDGFYRNGDLLFLLIMPAKDFTTMEVIERPLADIRAAIAKTRAEFPGIDAGLTGRPVLAADEIETSNRDMNWATAIAILLVGAVFIFFFRSLSRPLLAMASLVMGIAWTFGLVALLYGTLNLLSVVFSIILVGATIEYAIHVVARYQEELARDGDPAAAMARALALMGPADATSALTTAAAFLTITWTDFTALAQLGVIASSGILLCLAAMLLVLPAMIIARDRGRAPGALRRVRPFALPHIGLLYRRPGLLFAAAAAITAVSIPLALRVGFDNNLLNLQARGLESVKYEHLILEKSGETTWFARAVAGSIAQSHRMAGAFERLPSVRRVDDVERILPEGQGEKIEAVRKIAPAFEGVSFKPASGKVDERRLAFELGRLAGGLDSLQEQAFSAGRVDAVEELDRFSSKIRSLVSALSGADAQALARLGRFQGDFLGDLHKNLEILATGMDPVTIEIKDLPADVVGRFVSPKGRYGLFIYPAENIWDPAALAKFVDEIRGVDESVTGTPIEVHESARLMRETFLRSAALAFLVICLLVWIDFRSLRASLLAVMPLAVGVLWLLGVMGATGVPFNMANFFAIPIIIGIGVDFGVQLAHRLRQERSFAAMGSATGKAVVLTAAANAIGFGTMVFAHHRGIASLGLIMAAGCVSCLAAALVAMPPVAKWLKWGGES
ncbi:MAG: MMPL family transporter [Proteobacteria bacterium]|nr:MMPL family transporter [Pseudomonadota bacterium]